MLASEGYRVIMTRESDILLYDPSTDYKGHKKQQDLAKRLEVARENEGAVFVSIHMNSFTESKYSGMQVYYSANNPTSRKLAERIREYNVRDLQPYNKRQIKEAGSNIYLLDRMSNPSVLIECGFLSNAAECQRLCDVEYQRSLAFVIFSAIKESLPEIYGK
jgi:N-acetylmuramoyl-L-alanine amidase